MKAIEAKALADKATQDKIEYQQFVDTIIDKIKLAAQKGLYYIEYHYNDDNNKRDDYVINALIGLGYKVNRSKTENTFYKKDEDAGWNLQPEFFRIFTISWT